jgi:sensor c-di-GMP phosphodiesterase-like protein
VETANAGPPPTLAIRGPKVSFSLRQGVETAAMAETLKDAGCHYGQGFGYAPPMSSEEALVYIIEHELDRR